MTNISKPSTDDQQSTIEDLNVTEDEAVDVKGGEQRPGSILAAMGDSSVR